jgi:hypothetical protein
MMAAGSIGFRLEPCEPVAWHDPLQLLGRTAAARLMLPSDDGLAPPAPAWVVVRVVGFERDRDCYLVVDDSSDHAAGGGRLEVHAVPLLGLARYPDPFARPFAPGERAICLWRDSESGEMTTTFYAATVADVALQDDGGGGEVAVLRVHFDEGEDMDIFAFHAVRAPLDELRARLAAGAADGADGDAAAAATPFARAAPGGGEAEAEAEAAAAERQRREEKLERKRKRREEAALAAAAAEAEGLGGPIKSELLGGAEPIKREAPSAAAHAELPAEDERAGALKIRLSIGKPTAKKPKTAQAQQRAASVASAAAAAATAAGGGGRAAAALGASQHGGSQVGLGSLAAIDDVGGADFAAALAMATGGDGARANDGALHRHRDALYEGQGGHGGIARGLDEDEDEEADGRLRGADDSDGDELEPYAHGGSDDDDGDGGGGGYGGGPGEGGGFEDEGVEEEEDEGGAAEEAAQAGSLRISLGSGFGPLLYADPFPCAPRDAAAADADADAPDTRAHADRGGGATEAAAGLTRTVVPLAEGRARPLSLRLRRDRPARARPQGACANLFECAQLEGTTAAEQQPPAPLAAEPPPGTRLGRPSPPHEGHGDGTRGGARTPAARPGAARSSAAAASAAYARLLSGTRAGPSAAPGACAGGAWLGSVTVETDDALLATSAPALSATPA